MISIYKKDDVTVKSEGDVKELEIRGLSTDTKPTKVNNRSIINGSTFIEIDTGKLFIYDLENEQWKEV